MASKRDRKMEEKVGEEESGKRLSKRDQETRQKERKACTPQYFRESKVLCVSFGRRKGREGGIEKR